MEERERGGVFRFAAVTSGGGDEWDIGGGGVGVCLKGREAISEDMRMGDGRLTERGQRGTAVEKAVKALRPGARVRWHKRVRWARLGKEAWAVSARSRRVGL